MSKQKSKQKKGVSNQQSWNAGNPEVVKKAQEKYDKKRTTLAITLRPADASLLDLILSCPDVNPDKLSAHSWGRVAIMEKMNADKGKLLELGLLNKHQLAEIGIACD